MLLRVLEDCAYRWFEIFGAHEALMSRGTFYARDGPRSGALRHVVF